MILLRRTIALILFSIFPASAILASEGSAVSPSAYKLGELFGGLPITNAMVTSWVISLVLILCVRWAVKTPQLIPTRGQAVVESFISGIRDIIVPIVGKRMAGPTFPILMGYFTFVLIHNWSGLIPGVGTFGYYDESGHMMYWFRPGNADLNMTLALAIMQVVFWLYFIFKYAGLRLILYDLFGNKAEKNEVAAIIYYPLFLVFFGVGIIELISIAFRPVSLSFRLFGNMFGGENLLTSMTGLVGWIVPVPFYFLELLIGVVQALVFTLLVAVYIGLICNHDSEEHAH